MMKKTTWILGIALAGLVAFGGAGCKKEAPVQKATTYDKVEIDVPKLREAVGKAGPDATKLLRDLTMHLRYKRYPEATEVLGKIKELPGLTDDQKKVVDDVTGQVNQAAKNQEAAPAPQ